MMKSGEVAHLIHLLKVFGVTFAIHAEFIIVKPRVDVDEVQVLELAFRMGFQPHQALHRSGKDLDLLLRAIPHIRQVKARDEIVAVAVLFVEQVAEVTDEVFELKI